MTQLGGPDAAPFIVAWWNTSLTPPVSRANLRAVDRKFVIAQIRQMRQEQNITVLGLCEVNTEDLEAIVSGIGDSSLQFIDATSTTSRPRFDVAFIYDETRVKFLSHRSLVERVGNSKLKLGEVATFLVNQEGQRVNFVASHWPSRRTEHERSGRRIELGSLLRASIRDLRSRAANDYFILMGDYNDDPFSPSLAEHLFATRDRELARERKDYFYNPFWRRLGESLPDRSATAVVSVCGTYFYHGGGSTRWYTFDQIIFGSEFLRDGPMTLYEEATGIVFTPELNRRLRDRRDCVDHLPVISAFNLRSLS